MEIRKGTRERIKRGKSEKKPADLKETGKKTKKTKGSKGGFLGARRPCGTSVPNSDSNKRGRAPNILPLFGRGRRRTAVKTSSHPPATTKKTNRTNRKQNGLQAHLHATPKDTDTKQPHPKRRERKKKEKTRA